MGVQATPLVPRWGGVRESAEERWQRRGGGRAEAGAWGDEKESVERELEFGDEGPARSRLHPTPPPESTVGAGTRSLSILSSRPTVEQSTSHERSWTGGEEGLSREEKDASTDKLTVALEKWREREADRERREGARASCFDDVSPWSRRNEPESSTLARGRGCSY
jgi:hypothetical protein